MFRPSIIDILDIRNEKDVSKVDLKVLLQRRMKQSDCLLQTRGVHFHPS